MKGESMGKKLVIAAEVLVLVAVIIGTYFFFTKNETKSTDKEPSQTSETTARSSSQEVDPLDKLMDEMTLEEKVGQLFFVRVPEINQIEDIQAYHLGGYVLFSRDTDGETQESLRQKIASYQDASDVPLLIGSDEEGGTVTRISQNPNLAAQPFASPQAIYASSGWEGIVEDTKQKADILTDLGINTGLFPIADVATDPNAFIYDRTIGLDADGTSEFVEKVVTTLKEAKSGSTLKHFPGYGNNRDSHVEIVTDERPLEEVEADYLPFEAGIKAGADSILVSHNIIASIDPDAPASISTKVHEVLRNQLNFDGVVMTDDMDMAGLANFISQEEAGLKALQAGNDLVMSSSYQQQIPYVIQAVQNGDYSEEQLNESVRRVLKWKQQLGLI
jgi:beta-N-acetylhexosaminidase